MNDERCIIIGERDGWGDSQRLAYPILKTRDRENYFPSKFYADGLPQSAVRPCDRPTKLKWPFCTKT
jgi:hypothetical protein